MNVSLKSGLRACGVVVLATAALGAQASTSVGVSVQVSQPGVYGRVDIGQFPQPQVVVQQPVVIQPMPRYQRAEPVYLWVPPGHQRNWRRHCGEYRACGVPVYFVQDRWYHEHVMRGDEQGRYGERDERRDERRDDRRDGRDDRRHDDNPHDRGHGRGRGHD
jgi:hypothetical protein